VSEALKPHVSSRTPFEPSCRPLSRLCSCINATITCHSFKLPFMTCTPASTTAVELSQPVVTTPYLSIILGNSTRSPSPAPRFQRPPAHLARLIMVWTTKYGPLPCSSYDPGRP